MKLLQDTTEDKQDRKFMKSQMEKRRRQRMNCSLEHLRTMLLQEPQQLNGAQGRVEKAEILERTVLFLQKTAKGDKSRAGGAAAAAAGGGEGQKKPFQDGFSSCLQRAAQFLGPQGKGLWLTAALDSYFADSVAQRSDSESPLVQRRIQSRIQSICSSGSLTRTKFLLQMLRQKSRHGLRTKTADIHVSLHPYQRPVQQVSPTAVSSPPQTRSQHEIGVTNAGSKQSLVQKDPVNQTLWRPWP